MLTENPRLLLTEANIDTAFPITEVFARLLKILIGMHYLLKFILPPVDEQGQEREYDLDIGLITIASAISLALVTSILEKIPAIKPKPRNIMSIIFGHFSSVLMYMGILFGFSQDMAILLAKDYGQSAEWLVDVSNWFVNDQSWVRAIIASPPIFVFTGINFLFTRAELTFKRKGTDESSPLLYEHADIRTRSWNRYSIIQWALNIIGVFISNYEFSLLPLSFAAFYGISPSKNFVRNFPLVIGILAAFAKLVPDHPFVTKEKHSFMYAGKIISRFFDKFFTLLLRNSSFSFMYYMNLMALIAASEHIDPKNSTTATIQACYFFLSIYISEVYFRIASVLNDAKATTEVLLKTWDFVAKICKSFVAWANIMSQYPYALIPMMVLGITDFIVDNFVDIKKLTGWEKICILLPDGLNQVSFNIGLLLQLTRLQWPLSLEIGLPTAVLFLFIDLAAKYNSRLEIIARIVNSGLLGSGSFHALQLFANIYGKNMPAYVEYIFLGFPIVLQLPIDIYGCVVLQRKNANKKISQDERQLIDQEVRPEPTNDVVGQRKNSITNNKCGFFSNTKFNRAVSYLPEIASTLLLIIGLATLNKFMQAFDQGDTASTGENMMMVAIVVCAVFMLYTSCRNVSYKRAANSTNGDHNIVKENSYTEWFSKFKCCKRDSNNTMDGNHLNAHKRLTMKDT